VRHGIKESRSIKPVRALQTGVGLCLLFALTGCLLSPTPQLAQASNSADGVGVLNVADAAIAGNDPQMALQVSESVLASDPQNLQALYHEAASYYALNRCEDATAAYQLALKIDPTSSEAETGIGRCLLQRDAAAAALTFAKAVRDDPHNAAAQNDLGIAFDLQGNYADAIGPYQQALLLAPGVIATEVNLGLSLALAGNGQDALQYLGPLATSPEATPKIREDYAVALLSAGRRDEARQVLSIDLPPDQAQALLTGFTNILARKVQMPASQPSY
jgi:Flp pilus assembly protein TadD